MDQSPAAMRAKFWTELAEIRTGLLGLAGGDGEAQPMTAHFTGAGRQVWFIARADSPLTAAAKGGAEARFHYAGKDHDFFACIGGKLVSETDGGVLDRFWTPDVSRWFADKNEAAALRFELDGGKTWIPGESVDGCAITFG